ncbi:annexin-2 receptor-like [Papio anubis]|uniref:Annexin A2 receptor n=1 Tax=Papio anubis TaxID=9555 RepID=A0A096N8A6_PAPAN|nr:annexin-2 receptor-like [Papio anubis]XP_031522010.1 annexin-2 receptor-like [Papio anubis]
MEQHFLGCVKRAWDSAEVAPEPGFPPIVSSEDRGPWPLPLYPVLGEYSLDSCDLGPLSSPCWRLPGVYWQNGLFPGVQSTLEPSTAKSPEFGWPGTQKQQEASVEEVGQGEEPDRLTLQQLSWCSPPHSWNSQQDTDLSDSGCLSERRHPPALHLWRHPPGGFSDCLERILRVGFAAFSVLWACCLRICGAKQP